MQYTEQRHVPVEVTETLLEQIVRSMPPKNGLQTDTELRARALRDTFHQQLTAAMLRTKISADNPPITIENIHTYFDLSDMEREMVEMAKYFDRFQEKLSIIFEALIIIKLLRDNWALSPKLEKFLRKSSLELASCLDDKDPDRIYNRVQEFRQIINEIQRKAVLLVITVRQRHGRLRKIPAKFLLEAAAFLDEFDKLSTVLRLFIAEAAKNGSIKAFTTERFRDF